MATAHRPLPSGVSGERRGRRWPWSTSSPARPSIVSGRSDRLDCWPWSHELTGAARLACAARTAGPWATSSARSCGSCNMADLGRWPWSTCSAELQRIQPEALDAPDFVGIGAKPARQDGRRGPRSSRSGVTPLLPLRALDAVLCAHRPARGVNWIGRSSSPGPPTIRTLGADGRSPLPLRPRSNVIAALKAMAEV